MTDRQGEFFDVMIAFKKLNISSIIPAINHGDFAILKATEAGNKKNDGRGARVSFIAKELRMPMPAISRGLRHLELDGYLERTVDREDRRNTFVTLTEKGYEILSETETIMNEFADAVFLKMGDENMLRLNQFLRELLETTKEEIASRKYQGKKGELENETNI